MLIWNWTRWRKGMFCCVDDDSTQSLLPKTWIRQEILFEGARLNSDVELDLMERGDVFVVVTTPPTPENRYKTQIWRL